MEDRAVAGTQLLRSLTRISDGCEAIMELNKITKSMTPKVDHTSTIAMMQGEIRNLRTSLASFLAHSSPRESDFKFVAVAGEEPTVLLLRQKEHRLALGNYTTRLEDAETFDSYDNALIEGMFYGCTPQTVGYMQRRAIASESSEQ